MSTANKDLPQRRRPVNLLLRPKLQIRYILVLLITGLLMLLSVFVFVFRSFSNLIARVVEYPGAGEEVRLLLEQTLESTAAVFVIFAVAFSLLTFWFGAIVTHRIIGPMVPIRRQIQALTKGDYSARGKLRANDDFVDIMDDLNDLARALEERHR